MNELSLQNIIVIGAGTMGQGIAQWFVQNKIQVFLLENNDQQLNKAKTSLDESWNKLLEKKKFSAEDIASFKQNIHFYSTVDSLSASLENKKISLDLIIEAIIENEAIKRKVFEELITYIHHPCFLCTNTSGLSIASLGRYLPPAWKKKFLGMHFFNPATLMPLVELIPSPWTDLESVDQLSQWLENHHKKPVTCQDRPGFIVNRLNRNFYGEPMRIAATFDSQKFKEIDHILKEVGGFKMGPFELMDMIGMDINFQVTEHVWKEFFYSKRFTPHHLQKSLYDSGRLGRKTGEGFFHYE